MGLWRIDIFRNKDDSQPYRSGYVHAADENEAAQKVTEAMGSDPRGGAIKVTSRSIPSMPTDKILWDLID